MKEWYYLFNLETKTTSKKCWATYQGALRNCSELEIVSTLDGIDWCIRHPDWVESRKEYILKTKI